jgi:hypothetical protein
MKLKMKPKKWPQADNPKSYEERARLMAKSLLVFGRSNHYKSVMKRGRMEPDVENKRAMRWHPISLQEIEDTMDYILKTREEKQNERSEEVRQGQTEDGAGAAGGASGSGESDDVRGEEI